MKGRFTITEKCMDMMYPVMFYNIYCNMNLSNLWYLYAVVYVADHFIYSVINGLLTAKLPKVNLAEVLKNRE